MSQSIRPGLLLTVMVLAAASGWGRAAETGQLKVDLISDTASIQPGRPLLVGLHFEMKQGWHLYWRNPGDSGMPPQVRWKLPPGCRAGEIQWPVPERLGSGSVIDYGYREALLLPVEIQTPGNLPAAGGNLTLSAEVSWLVCENLCVPGQAELTLTLPVAEAPGPPSAFHALFQETDPRLPRPMPPAWRVEASSEKDVFVVTVHGEGLGSASFFPLEADQVDNAAPQTLAPIPGGVRLTLRKSEQLAKTPDRLEGVLKLGPGRAYVISVPVRPHPGQAATSWTGCIIPKAAG